MLHIHCVLVAGRQRDNVGLLLGPLQLLPLRFVGLLLRGALPLQLLLRHFIERGVEALTLGVLRVAVHDEALLLLDGSLCELLGTDQWERKRDEPAYTY